MTSPRQHLRRRVENGETVWFAGAQDALSALLVDQSDFDGVFTTGFGISAIGRSSACFDAFPEGGPQGVRASRSTAVLAPPRTANSRAGN